ncbi:MAG: hypothetical protein GY895_01205 [Phycisphaera sp.]|nr:hypothetical protein [Phycisphaera sp.]
MDLSGFEKREIPEQALAELQHHFDEPTLRIGTARVRQHAVGCDILVNVEWWDSGNDGPGYEVRHTVVFLHRPQTTLPEFEIRPRAGVAEKIFGGVGSLLGIPRLELEGEPELADRYAIMTANPESVRILMNRSTIDSLLAVEDLYLRFTGRGVLASRRSIDGSSGGRGSLNRKKVRDHRLEGKAPAQLLADTLIAAGPIVDDPALGRRVADAVEGTYAQEAVRHLEDSGGIIGREISKFVITGEMLSQMLKSTLPRREIPAPVARRAWGGTTFPLVLVLILAGVMLCVGVGLLAGGSKEGLIFGGVGLVASIIWIAILRHRLVRKSLITNGTAVEGRLAGVERTNTSVNDDPIHAITIATSDGGEPMVVKMGSGPAKQARRMMEAGKSTWILRDPGKPSRGLWIEGWCLDSRVD